MVEYKHIFQQRYFLFIVFSIIDFPKKKGWSVKLEHYLTTLQRKPGALAGSLALKQMPPKIQALFNKHFAGKARDFVFLLQYARDNNFCDNDIMEAYSSLVGRGVRSISADQIKAMMHANSEPEGGCTQPVCLDDTHQDKSSLIEDGAMRILVDLSRMMDAGNKVKITTKN